MEREQRALSCDVKFIHVHCVSDDLYWHVPGKITGNPSIFPPRRNLDQLPVAQNEGYCFRICFKIGTQ